jgi:hypothetical protein
MPHKLLNWANSKTIGGVSEIAVLAPIRRGRIPGERRTYEERLRFVIANLAGRVQQGIPNELDRIQTIHFGRMIIIRPEQYLVYSKVKGLNYEGEQRLSLGRGEALPERGIPSAIDDYLELGDLASQKSIGAPGGDAGENGADASTEEADERPEFRSWLLTLVEFDGDLRTYFRDIAEFLDSDFDKVFRNCEDFPSTRRFEAFWAWIRRYQIDVNLFYPRYPDLSVVRIKQLQEFKRQFDMFVAKVRSPTGNRIESMEELFDEFLRTTQQFARDFPSPGGVFKRRGD